MKWLLTLVVMLLVPTSVYAQAWSGILDTARAIDWSTAGVPGGIPSRTTVCSTIAAATYNNGADDATSGIQTALNGCASNQVVALGAGTFRINTNLTIPSNKVLRGAGASLTTLNLLGTGNAITFGTPTEPAAGTTNPITAGATKGSTSITVTGGTITTGQLLMISQEDLSYMTRVGSSGTCDWCDGDFPGNSDSGQIVRVTNVSGGDITFTPPLYIAYSDTPVAYRFNVGGTNIGLENLKLYANDTGYTNNIYMDGVTYSWVKGVESDFADGNHGDIRYSLGNEVRNSYFHDGFSHTSGSTDNQLNLSMKSSANLIINNIFYRQHVSVILQWGASGNVIAYNYSNGTYHEDFLSWMINDFNFHGAHPMMNLFEGNIGVKFQPDSTWGSSSHSTLFRNWFRGSNVYIPPLNARGDLTLGSAAQETANTYGLSIDYLSQYNNLVGTIVGSNYLVTTAGGVSRLTAPAVSSGNPACIRVGYNSDNDAAVDPVPSNTTLFNHGIYNCAEGTFTWDAGIMDHTLPPSFFLSSKPAWFAASTPWPPIGPDVTGGNETDGIADGYVNRIPAHECFLDMGGEQAAPLVFDPIACYPEVSVSPPGPPPVPFLSKVVVQ